MKRYKLVGSYSTVEPSYTENEHLYTTVVPMITRESMLKYGLGNVMSKLHANGIVPSEDGIDFLCLATLVYLADTRISREIHSQDSWTREITISLPVYNVDKWNSSIPTIKRMLNFLTGDLWEMEFSHRSTELAELPNPLSPPIELDAVTLFSGGMDSLIAAINLLEVGSRIAFISHAADSYTKNSQRKLLTHFNNKYPQNKPAYFDLWTAFEDELIESGGGENSTRSRSFLFIAYGVCVLSGIPSVNTLYVPENALIALNVPLDSLRIGSHSTRTTHPFYLGCWNSLLSEMEMGKSVINPYWDKTKGEMADECCNKVLLHSIISDSISCSSPQKLRYKGIHPQHCGYCVPCIIRRAAMARAYGVGNDPTEYYYDRISTIRANHASTEGVQLRSFEIAIDRVSATPALAKMLIHKSGPIEGDFEHLERLGNAYLRGLLEVDSFVRLSLENEKH
ncbi:MAG: hypothetical protein J6A88_00490 [Oscillospiraceae bacterium]|nr:hypothetical protein [Oscillospiraceae bacterium]